MTKLRVFEGFAGIGAVSKAIENLGIPHELVGYSEIDKSASKSFSAVHNVSEDLNWGDVCLIDETKLPDFDLYTFGSPCTNFSTSGKQKGSIWTCKDCDEEFNPLDLHFSKRGSCPKCKSENIEKTQSSLVVEALRIIRHKKPKYLLMENVKNLVSSKFKTSFDLIINELEEYGYNTYWKVLNAKDFGIPQNRERVIVISVRKDIDTGLFIFPQGRENGYEIKDLVDKRDFGSYTGLNADKMLAPNLEPAVRKQFLQDYEAIINTTKGVFRSKVKSNFQNMQVGITVAPCLRANNSTTHVLIGEHIVKISPIESWRFMGFKDEDFNKAKATGVSDTQLFKQAGNSIVVTVLEDIFKELFIESTENLHN